MNCLGLGEGWFIKFAPTYARLVNASSTSNGAVFISPVDQVPDEVLVHREGENKRCIWH